MPEHSGYPGGQLFSDYLQMHGKQVSLAKYDAICGAQEVGHSTWAEQEEAFNVIVRKEKHTFLGFMLSSLAKVSNYSKARQYHCTSSALHHGLSRYGHHFQAHLGNMMKLTNFDKERAKHLVKAEELARCF
jgi:hypothetical protein